MSFAKSAELPGSGQLNSYLLEDSFVLSHGGGQNKNMAAPEALRRVSVRMTRKPEWLMPIAWWDFVIGTFQNGSVYEETCRYLVRLLFVINFKKNIDILYSN